MCAENLDILWVIPSTRYPYMELLPETIPSSSPIQSIVQWTKVYTVQGGGFRLFSLAEGEDQKKQKKCHRQFNRPLPP